LPLIIQSTHIMCRLPPYRDCLKPYYQRPGASEYGTPSSTSFSSWEGSCTLLTSRSPRWKSVDRESEESSLNNNWCSFACPSGRDSPYEFSSSLSSSELVFKFEGSSPNSLSSSSLMVHYTCQMHQSTPKVPTTLISGISLSKIGWNKTLLPSNALTQQTIAQMHSPKISHASYSIATTIIS